MKNVMNTAQEQEMTGLAQENLSTGQEKYQQNKGTGLALVSASSAGSSQEKKQSAEQVNTRFESILREMANDRQYMEKLILEQRANSDKRFEDMNKRFDDMNKRFEDMNTRFKEQQAHSDKYFESILREMANDRQYMEKLLAEQRASLEKLLVERQANSDKLLAERQANSDKRFADMQKSFNRLVTTILAVMAMAVPIVIGLSQL